MARARNVLEKLKSSDGRIRIKTLSGISALVAVIALLVGVLPVMADHLDDPNTEINEGALVSPTVVDYGGGSGACAFVGSAAANELHINNPTPTTGDGVTYTDADGRQIRVKVYDLAEGRVFDFTVLTEGIVVYDVVVNGGPKNNHYAYDGSTVGTVTADKRLHAPRKNRTSLHNLSHVNICYDVPGVAVFACNGDAVTRESEGLFTIAQAQIFSNSVLGCTGSKRGSFFIDNTDTAEIDPSVTLAFQGNTGVNVAGRLEVTKKFATGADIVDLEYDGPGEFVPVQWCNVRDKVAGDGAEFDDVLESDEYPSLVGVVDVVGENSHDATSCKVHEVETANGFQFTVVYFELEDPQWR